jgi:hypothetical protein
MELEAKLSADCFGAVAKGLGGDVICVSSERAFFRAIIENLDPKGIPFGRKTDGNFCCSRVMERMEDRLLNDAIRVKGRLGTRAGHVSQTMKFARKSIFHPIRETLNRGLQFAGFEFDWMEGP